MTRKCHNHIRVANPWHDQEDPKKTYDTKFRIYQSTKLSVPHLDDCKTRKDKKLLQNKTSTNNKPPQTMVATRNNEFKKAEQLP